MSNKNPKKPPKNKGPVLATRSDLVLEWHPEKNASLDINTLSCLSTTRAWWRCQEGHEWQVSIKQRVKANSSCPECKKKTAIPREKSLAYLFPDLKNEWHPSKNGVLEAENFSRGSQHKAWWQCKRGHEWQSQIASRTRGAGCPQCKKIVPPEKSLAYLRPDILSEWHPTKNGDLTPQNVFAGSSKRYWWQCKRGHEWQAKVNNRVRINGLKCPHCKHLPEVEESISSLRPDLAKEWHPTKNGDRTPENFSPGSAEKIWWQCKRGHEWETLIFHRSAGTGCPKCCWLPEEGESLKDLFPDIAKEWSKAKNSDLLPEEISPRSRKKIWWQCSRGHEWEEAVSQRSLGKKCPKCEKKDKTSNKKIYLADSHPEISKEWHPTKNEAKAPTTLTRGSEYKAWWQCSRGHEWQAVVNNRTRGSGCPECSKKKVRLDVLYPEIAKEWHPTKNGRKLPSDFSKGAIHKAWWQCENGHEWQARIGGRTRGHGCPECQKIPQKSHSLLRQHPELIKEIHPSKNGKLSLESLGTMSHQKIIWLCENGHEWQAPIYHRTRGHGCRECADKTPYDKSLATLLPDLAKEWHLTKNKPRLPEEFSIGSDYKAWWQCENGHEWQAPIYRRYKGSGCPTCSKTVDKSKSLQYLHPSLAKEWHPSKNGNVSPNDVSPGSRYKAWWTCDRNHEWQAGVYARAGKGTRCPLCPRQVPYKKSLAALSSKLSSEWHSGKNDDLHPEDVTLGSSRKVWWRCQEGHNWIATVTSRVQGSGCPECTGGGYKGNRPGYVYLMYSKKYSCWQVGITNHPERRLKKHAENGEFELRELLRFEDGHKARDLENEILRSWRQSGHKPVLSEKEMPQGGWSETVAFSAVKKIDLSEWSGSVYGVAHPLE